MQKFDPGILESEQNNFGQATITDRTPQFHMRCHNSWEGISPSYYWFNLGGFKTISPHQGHPGGEERFAYLASLSAFLQRYNSLPWGNVPGTNIKALGHRCRRRQRFWCVPRQPLVLRGMARMVETPKHCAFGASTHFTCCWDVGLWVPKCRCHVSHGQWSTGGHHKQTVIQAQGGYDHDPQARTSLPKI